jgi:hypothetical protein
MHLTTFRVLSGLPDNQNLAGHASEFRVTRKVNLADRSAGYQCHSVFTQAYENLLTWLG